MFGNIVGTLPHLKSARVRAIAVSSAKRTLVLPDVPAIAETYPGFDITSWSGLFVPAATPREIVAKVSADVGRVLGRPDIRDRFAAQGAEALPGSPEQLAALVRRDTALYARVIRDAGIRAE
jgi:tripartite-type tricarboxylate transporter receptor subunit TctC